MNSIKVCEYSRSRSFHDDLILQDQASGERSQDHWSSGCLCKPKTQISCASFCDCTGPFVSDLVGNPEDRFSRDAAHLVNANIYYYHNH